MSASWLGLNALMTYKVHYIDWINIQDSQLQSELDRTLI